jgi:methyltransferase (TIGR00027 family)
MDRPLVFEDSLAIRVVSPDKQEDIAMAARERRSPGPFRAMAVSRSRFCEDALAAAVAERAVTQYILFGAGLDTFAYRSPFAASLRVFEVDYPATQEWKRSRLSEVGIAEPPWLTFVPLDLDRTNLMEILLAAGINTNAPSFFSALGLFNFLIPAAVVQVFRTVAAFRPDSEMAFDYVIPPNLVPPEARAAHQAWQERVAALGEPVQSFLIPSQLRDTMVDVGFRDVEFLDAAAINGRYFLGRRDDLRTPPQYALARAIV